MYGRKILSESDSLALYLDGKHPEMTIRRRVLRETIERFQNAPSETHFQSIAIENLNRWKAARDIQKVTKAEVCKGDWGDIALDYTKRFGECFACLNMANAYVPGGAYVEGAAAQEENMYRRTNCHFFIDHNVYDNKENRYLPFMTALLNAESGRVYLDIDNPRICLRGSENPNAPNFGYPWLSETSIFPFYELRSAAVDLRDGSSFSADNMRRRIVAQLETLKDKDVKYVILGAFGCGAFMNPAEEVAKIYHEEIAKRSNDFAMIVFAIHHAGYGTNNFLPFQNQFEKHIELGG